MAEVQLTVRQVSTQSPLVINLTIGQGGGEAGEQAATPAYAQSTGAACFSSISTLARHDPTNELNNEELENLQFTSTNEEGSDGESYGQIYGDTIRSLVDQFQDEVTNFVDGALQDDDPEQAILTLQNELDGIFGVRDGQGTFNTGRIMSMFYLTYSLVKRYYQRYGNEQFLTFIRQLVPSLVCYLFSIGFLSWLVFTGGWLMLKELTRRDSLVSRAFRYITSALVVPAIMWVSWKIVRRYLN